jgi:hypothetical protein
MALFSKTHTALSITDDAVTFISIGTEPQVMVRAYGRAPLASGIIVNGVLKKQKEFIHAVRSLNIKPKSVLLVTEEYPDELFLHVLGQAKIEPLKVLHGKDCLEKLFEGQPAGDNVWAKFFSLNNYIPPITKAESFAYAPALGAIVANM